MSTEHYWAARRWNYYKNNFVSLRLTRSVSVCLQLMFNRNSGCDSVALLIVSVNYLEIGKRMLNKRERESERVRFQGDNHNLAVEGRRGEVRDTKFLRPNVWDFNIISTMKNKNNSYRAVRHRWVNISI